jgi:hypothetical protein
MIAVQALAPAEGQHRRRPSFVWMIPAEFHRATTAARYYETLKREPAATADIPRRVFEEFYSRDA